MEGQQLTICQYQPDDPAHPQNDFKVIVKSISLVELDFILLKLADDEIFKRKVLAADKEKITKDPEAGDVYRLLGFSNTKTPSLNDLQASTATVTAGIITNNATLGAGWITGSSGSNKGDSGGPILDMNNYVLGINVANISGELTGTNRCKIIPAKRLVEAMEVEIINYDSSLN
jgi:hypothetical protein